MEVVTKCVNKIRARALNRREFRQFLVDLNEDFGELLLYCEVRWLSQGNMLARFWKLKRCVLQFLRENFINELPVECEQLADDEWLNDFAFLVDITQHLNDLNVKLQGSDNLFTDLYGHVAAFKVKLRLFIGQLTQKRLDNFTYLKSRKDESNIDCDKYASQIEILLEAFVSRFSDFSSDAMNVTLFSNPFAVTVEQIDLLAPELQLEVIDLQQNSVLKALFTTMQNTRTVAEVCSFWRALPVAHFSKLRSFAQRMISRFGSTYRCEQSFSTMKIIKSKDRSRLRDSNLKNLLTLATTKVEPEITKLASRKQVHHNYH